MANNVLIPQSTEAGVLSDERERHFDEDSQRRARPRTECRGNCKDNDCSGESDWKDVNEKSDSAEMRDRLHIYLSCSFNVIHGASFMSLLFIPKKVARNPSGNFHFSAKKLETVRGMTYEEDRHQCEGHDSSALLDAFICSLQCCFCFNDTCLLLLQR